MGIKALQNRKPRLPIVGQLKKGAKKPDGRPGKDLDGYFRFVSQIPEAVPAFAKIYSDKPSNVKFYFPYNDFDSNFDTCQEKYVKGKLEHRCDGEYVSLMKSNGRYIVPKADTVQCPGGCDWRGTLSMAVSDEGFLRQFGGVIVVRLKGKTEIATIHSQLLAVHEDMGSLRGFEFELYRYDKKINQPNGMRVTKSLVGIRHNDAILTALSQPTSVVDYDYEVDDDGVVLEDEETTRPAPPPNQKTSNWGKAAIEGEFEDSKRSSGVVAAPSVDNKAWFASLSPAQQSAAKGEWLQASEGISRYSGNIHQLKSAAKKIIEGGVDNFLLMKREGMTTDEVWAVGRNRVGLFDAVSMYATKRGAGSDEFDALKAVHATVNGAFAELLKPIATDDFDDITLASDATQAALIPNDDTPASQNAAMM